MIIKFLLAKLSLECLMIESKNVSKNIIIGNKLKPNSKPSGSDIGLPNKVAGSNIECLSKTRTTDSKIGINKIKDDACLRAANGLCEYFL